MGLMFRICLIASVVFALSYGATINQYDFNANELDSLTKLEPDEILPMKYEDINNKFPQNSNCPKHPKPADCAEIFENGYNTSGVYKVYPKNKVVSCEDIRVYCDMKTDGGGWTVIQRRGNFNRPADYFHKDWVEYKNGFGHLEKEFWLGNDDIYALTNQKRYTVRFDLGTETETAYATYDIFSIENEELKYRLSISEYSGTAGDSMVDHHKMAFSTKDRKNNSGTTDCAMIRKGGWWYHDCAGASLNGVRLTGNYTEGMVNTNGTYWRAWKGYKKSLSTVEIKIRPFVFPSE